MLNFVLQDVDTFSVKRVPERAGLTGFDRI